MQRIQAPEWVNRPLPESWFLWQAYHVLRGSRTSGGNIPHRDIMAYCDECGMSCPVERGRMVRAIFAMNNMEPVHGATA